MLRLPRSGVTDPPPSRPADSHTSGHAGTRDSVLIAQALEDDLSVLTRDAAFADYGVRSPLAHN
jgi:PIN domain nuclease of toxin-antitoxin system